MTKHLQAPTESLRRFREWRYGMFIQEGNRVFLTGLPRKAPDPTLTVLAFDLAGRPRGVPNPLLPKFT